MNQFLSYLLDSFSRCGNRQKKHLQVLPFPPYFAILVLAHTRTSDPRNWIVGDPTVMQVDEEIHMFTNGARLWRGPVRLEDI